MLVIGEDINTSNRSVAEALARIDKEFVANLARAQPSAGADFIEVNTGAGHNSRQHQKITMEPEFTSGQVTLIHNACREETIKNGFGRKKEPQKSRYEGRHGCGAHKTS